MTTTSIKDVSAVMKAYAQNAGNTAAGAASKTSFQSIWNNQTGKNAASENAAYEAQEVEKQPKTDKAESRPEESFKVKEGKKPEVKEVQEMQQTEEVEGEVSEEAMEVLASATMEIMQQVADTFGMSMEELQQLMEEMNMSALDLLDSAKFSELLLAAGGAQDTLALLTDEALCKDFQMLMSQQKQMLADIAKELNMTPEQLQQTIQEMSQPEQNTDNVWMNSLEQKDATSDELPIEIETETDDISMEKNYNNNQKSEVDGLAQNKEVNTVSINENNSAQTENGQEKSSEHPQEQNGNLLLQNLKNDNFQPQLQQTAQTSQTWTADTQDIMRQIMDYLKIQIKPDMSSMEMQLHPESLGTVQVHVASKGGLITANFITENETVKAALESQMVQLKENFAEQGVKVEAIEVTVQAHEFERNLEQGRGRQQGEPEKKNKTRRINLDALLEMDESEVLSEEEQLVAEMMTANGSTVDYTA